MRERRGGFDPWVGHGNPLSYSCLGNPMDRGPWWAIVHGAAKELDKEMKQQNRSSRDAGCLLWNLTVVLCPSWITSFVLLPEGDPEASAVTQWKLLEERRMPLHLFFSPYNFEHGDWHTECTLSFPPLSSFLCPILVLSILILKFKNYKILQRYWEKAMAPHSSSCPENPMDGGAW